MSDDKNKKDSTSSDGAGPDSGKSESESATKLGFGELLGAIDSRIEAALRRNSGKGPEATGTKTDNESDPRSVADQVRQEIAKLNGEREAADKDAARDVTIQELKEQVTKLTEAKPEENVSRLTQIMWGKRKKS